MRPPDDQTYRSFDDVLAAAGLPGRRGPGVGVGDRLRLVSGPFAPRPEEGATARELEALQREVRAVGDEVRALRSLVNTGRRKYDLDGAAERLGVSVRSVRRRIAEGQLVASKEGGRVFVTESALRDYEDACRRRAA